jgi:hypothetical protein
MSPELALVFACLRPYASPDHLPARADLNWSSVLAIARRHQVLPQLEQMLSATDWQGVPPNIRTELQAYVMALDVRNAYLTSTLVAVVHALHARGVRALAFKGPTLAALYPPPARRAFSDLDLLISNQDVLAAEALLIELGFSMDPPFARPAQVAYVGGLRGWRRRQYLLSRSEHHFRRDPDRLLVDLHLKLADPFIRIPLHFDDLYARSSQLRLDGENLRVPCAEDLLLIVSINAAKDLFGKLLHFLDCAQIAQAHPELDWRAVSVRAQQLGVHRILAVTLDLARQLADLPRPTDAHPHRLAATALHRLTSGTPRPPLLSFDYTRLQLRMRERFSDRLWYCLWLVFAPSIADWMFIPLPQRLQRLYVVFRPVRLILSLAAPASRVRRAPPGPLRPG